MTSGSDTMFITLVVPPRFRVVLTMLVVAVSGTAKFKVALVNDKAALFKAGAVRPEMS